jgi:hypothetical protein
MGVNTIIRGVLAIFFIGLIWLSMMPEMYKITHNETMWGDVEDPRALGVRDMSWNMYLGAGVIAMFSIFVWMINASTRKTASTAYE